MHHELADDEIEFREKCRTFAKEVIEPNYIACDRENKFPADRKSTRLNSSHT